MNEIEKIQIVTTLVIKLFYNKGTTNLKKEILNEWVEMLFPFDIELINLAILNSKREPDNFPVVGKCYQFMNNYGQDDSSLAWSKIEKYCGLCADYFFNRSDLTYKDIQEMKLKIGSEDFERFNIICGKVKYNNSDNYQREQWRNQFIKLTEKKVNDNTILLEGDDGHTKRIT